MKNALAGALLVGLSCMVSFGLGELVLAMLHPLPLPVRDPQVRYVDHAVRGFSLAPGQVSFSYGSEVCVDEQGSRRNGHGPEETDAPRARVIALGDSFTFGMGVSDEETWPAVLERLLPGVRVHNLGTISYGVDQELDLLRERSPDLAPDLVIHGLYWNDYMPAVGVPSRDRDPARASVLTEEGTFLWDPVPPRTARERLAQAIFTRSRVAHLGKQLMRGWLSNGPESTGTGAYERAYQRFVNGDDDPTDWAVLERFYDRLTGLGRERGFDVLVVAFPVVGMVERGPDASRAYRARLARLLEDRGIAWVDGFEVLESAGVDVEVFLPYNRHLDDRGYALIADALRAPTQRLLRL